MNPPKPHFLLFCEGNHPATEAALTGSQRSGGSTANNNRWRFVLEDVVSGERFEASDKEIGCPPDRAALVAVLRGLEALEQPSRVTLVTNSRYVHRGLQYGLNEWRENDFSWEHFGAVQPIRNADLWRRIDRALSYHQVQCRWMQHDDESREDTEAQLPTATALPTAAIVEQTDAPKVIALEKCDAVQGIALVDSFQNATTKVRIDSEHTAVLNSPAVVSVSVSSMLAIPETQRAPAKSPNLFKDSGISGREHAPTSETTGKVHCVPSHSRSIPCCEPQTRSAIAEQTLRTSTRWKLLYPFAIVWTLCKRSLIALWDAILRLDEFIESYLRCMLLLDPKPHRRR